MESELAPVVYECSSQVQDRMGDVHSKDKNLKSPKSELLQVDSKPSSPDFSECPAAFLDRAPFISPTKGYPVYSSSDSFVDIAVEALEDDEISKENEAISCIEHSSNLLISEGHNTSHPISSDKTIHQIYFEEKVSTKVIQKVLSIEAESIEIPPAFSVETESTEMPPALSVETEFTEEIQPALSAETESNEEIQPAFSVETESNEEIKPALSVDIESNEEIQPALSVESENFEVQPSLPQEFESTEDIQPALSRDIESKKKIQLDFSEEIKPKVINPALSGETIAETENIQETLSADITSTVIIQPVAFEKTESTKSVQHAHSKNTLSKIKQPEELNEVIESHPVAGSCKEKVFFSPESKKSQIPSNDLNLPLDPEVLSKVISEPELHFSNLEENSNSSFPPALEKDSFLSLLNTEEYKNASVFEYVNDRAVSGGSVIITPTSPSPEPIFPNLVLTPLSPLPDTPPMKSNEKQNRSSESIQHATSEETKLSKVKQPVLSEEIDLNEVIELNSLEARSIEKAISAFQSKTSPIPSSDRDPSAELKVLSKTYSDSSNSASNQSRTSRIPSNDMDSSSETEVFSKGLSKSDLNSSNSEEHSNSFPPMLDTESFFSLLNTEEYKNASYLGHTCLRQVTQSGCHAIFNPHLPVPEPKFPIFEIPPLSPTTESRLTKMIENFNSLILSNQDNSGVALTIPNSEEKSNPSVPPVSDNERFGSALNIKESNYGKSSAIPGKGGMTVNTSTPCQPSPFIFEMLPSLTAKNHTKELVGNFRSCKDAIVPTDFPRTTCEPSLLNFETLPSLPTKKLQVNSVGSLNTTKDAVVPTSIPSTKCKPSSLNFEMIPSPPARNRPKKLLGNLNPGKDATVPTGIPSTTCQPIFPNLEVLPLSPAKNGTTKLVGNSGSTKEAIVPTNTPRTTCEGFLLNFEMQPSPSKKKPVMKSIGNSNPTTDTIVPTDIPRTTCSPISSNLKLSPLSPTKNRTMKFVNSRPAKKAVVPKDIPRTTCEPSSLDFEMLPSPPARKRVKKSSENLRPTKNIEVFTDNPSATCKPIFPDSEVPPLSTNAKNLPEKNIQNLSPTKASPIPDNRFLSSLLSRFADWIYRGMEKSSKSFEKPLDIDFINNFSLELGKGVDILDEMATFMDALITAVEGLPDPNSLFPYEWESEKFPIRDRLVSAGLVVQRKLVNMKTEVILDGDAVCSLFSDEEKLNNTELALKAHDIIFRLYVKTSEKFLNLGMDIDRFRDNNRDFCYKIDILLNGYVLDHKFD